jgi:hypothetical protein
MAPTELSEQEDVDEDELSGLGVLVSDPMTVVSDGSDEESSNKERQHVGYSLEGVWKFYEIKVLNLLWDCRSS